MTGHWSSYRKQALPSDPNRKDEGEFTREPFAAMLTELQAYLKPLVRFLYFTGMRVMEAAGLTWAEVNLKHRELRVLGSAQRMGSRKFCT